MNKELERKLEKLWLDFNAAGIVNPLTVIEQITYLIFLKLLDEREFRNEHMRKKGLKAQFIFNEEDQHLRWNEFRHKKGDEMLKVIRDDVFPHMREFTAKDENFGQFFKDAILMIPTGRLMQSAVDQVDVLPLSKGDDKGDLYEWMLNRITQSGLNGQFRTPRHIIQLMVEMLDPQPTDYIADPAAGTAGFLIGTYLHILKNHSSKDGQIEHEDDEGNKHTQYLGDLLTEYQEHIQNGMLTGFEMDATMLRIGAMNLLLHGIDSPHIFYQDSLGKSFKESKKYGKYAENYFDVVLANPPFKGTVDEEHLDTKLTGDVNTKKTELLFLVRMLKMLKPGGRCASIVPDGVLFGSSKAHKNLRKMLIDDNQLEGIVSLPSGVFKPYAGVSTAIVIFTKSGKTKDVWFYDVENDGFSLDDKRQKIDKDDLPDCLQRWQKKDPEKDTDRKEKAFFVPKKEIVENNYDLSVNRYKEIAYVEEEYDAPKDILKKLKSTQLSIDNDLTELSKYVDDEDYKGFDPNTAKRRIKLDKL